MDASRLFADASPTPSTSGGAGTFFDWFDIAGKTANSYFQYDLAKRELKAAKEQQATSYAQGYNPETPYGYTGFTNDGGLVGGISGLKGDQVFLLGLATIAIFWIARKG